MKEIQLTQGKIAIVDDDDFELLSSKKWQAEKVRGNYYRAFRHETRFFIKKKIYMHRAVMNCSGNEIIDHKNGNALDNRKSNLRVCTHAENMRNRRSTKNQFGYKGVKRYKNKYKAVIHCDNKEIHVGVYETAEDAARGYDEKAVELFGDFARLNFQK